MIKEVNLCNFCHEYVPDASEGNIVGHNGGGLFARKFESAVDTDICICTTCANDLSRMKFIKDSP